MHLTAISALNYLSHRGLNIVIDPDTRVLLVAGPNGIGKTAIAQAVKLAFRGEPIRGLTYKKDLAQLITQGEKDGEVIVTATDGDIGGDWGVNLRTTARVGVDLAPSTVSLDPAEFFAMPPQDRRHLLFTMAGIKLTPSAIKEVLVGKGHEPKRIDRVIHHLRVGFDAAATEARTAATEARGAWKATTGEAYGEVKAVGWKAPKVTNTPVAPIDQLTEAVASAEHVLQMRQAEQQNMRDAAAAWKNAQTSLKAKGTLSASKKALQAETDTHRQLVERVREAERSLPPMAEDTGEAAFHCPECATALAYDARGKVILWKKGTPPDAGAIEAREKLAKLRNDAENSSAEVARLRYAVEAGQQAERVVNDLPKQPDEAEVKKLDNDVAAAKSALTIAQTELASGQASMLARTQAEDKTRIAAEHHADVLGFAALADAVQNLPAEYLTKTLTAINYHTTGVSTHAKFDKPVAIGEDMEARYGTIPYGLASESQQWRIHAAVGYALAVMSGLGILVLDKFDDVEPKSRGAILRFFGEQEDDVQTVLCATLKERPNLPAPPFQVVWLGG